MNILTFDIEDWFNLLEHPLTDDINNWNQFESRVFKSTEKILDLLDECNYEATFFVLGWVAENHPKIVNEIHRRGHKIGSHSYAHKVAYSQTKKEFKDDFTKSIKLIEDLTGCKVDCYRAPGFSVTPNNMWVYDILLEHGITYDSSIFPASRNHGGFKNFPISEPFKIERQGEKIFSFPLNTRKIFNYDIVYSGGGYFRLLPEFIINNLIKNDSYVMTYFHPRDFDYDQPSMANLSLLRRFRSYYGIKGAYKKLKNLLKKNDFISLHQANSMVNWEDQPVIELADFLN